MVVCRMETILFRQYRPHGMVVQHSFTRLFVIGDKPINGLLDSFVNRSEFVIGQEFAEFMVGGRLFELTVRLGGIKFYLTFEFHGLGNRQGDILDTNFVFFVHRKRNGSGIVIVRAQSPDGQFGQVAIVNELTQGRATSPNRKRFVLFFCNITFVNQSRDDMSPINREIIMRTVNIGGNDRSKVATILFRISTVQSVNQTLRVGISLVGRMRGSIVKHAFINRISGLVGKDTSRKEGNQFFDLVDSTAFHNVVVDEDIFTKEFHLVFHIGKQTTDLGCQVQHVSRFVLFKNGFRIGTVAQITILGSQKDPFFRRTFLGCQKVFNRLPHQASATGHKDHERFVCTSVRHVAVFVLLLHRIKKELVCVYFVKIRESFVCAMVWYLVNRSWPKDSVWCE
mmetsp:Transcript_3980/g.7942  ORF Transcript_3980/g.7942 Transcript_3980/m.7942 type:complete len:396 (+) Transcript_3980:66-1253(+)